MSHALTVTWPCPKCNAENEVTVEPYRPAQVAGPPEKWAPAEGGAYEPDCCLNCGYAIQGDDVAELAADREEQLRDDAADLKYRERAGK